MAIIEHWPVFSNLDDPPKYIVVCDYCGKHATSQASKDPGKSAQAAKNTGFTTKKVGLGNPLEWRCPKCKDK